MKTKSIRLKLRFVADGTSRSRHLASLNFRGSMCKKKKGGGGKTVEYYSAMKKAFAIKPWKGVHSAK